jgi:proteasome accessory factor B
MNLTIALLVARHYVTKARLRQTVEEYRDSTDEAFEKMFERDKDELRELGIPIELGSVVSGFEDEVGYRIRRSEFELPELEISAAEASILGLAARVWQHARMAEATTQAMLKLRAGGVDVDPQALEILTPRLPATEPAFEPLMGAVTRRQAVTFPYRRTPGIEPTGRHVEPWGVVFANSRWYVVGHDRDRAGTRVFRLSRIVGTVETIGEPGGFDVPDVDVAAEARSLVPRPPTADAIVHVRRGAGVGLRRHAGSTRSVDDAWDELVIPFSSYSAMTDELLGYGSDVIAIEPADLRAQIVDRLRDAAS